MKIRIYPKKEHVLSVLRGVESRQLEDYNLAVTALDELNNLPLFVSDGDRNGAVRLVDGIQAELSETRQEIAMIESHTPEEVMAELELP